MGTDERLRKLATVAWWLFHKARPEVQDQALEFAKRRGLETVLVKGSRAILAEAVNAFSPEQAEWDRREAYRKGFEEGGRLERERADWLEEERERLQATVAALKKEAEQSRIDR